nr:MAG TPA: hypothetical protein [Caudoviricetes sp.]
MFISQFLICKYNHLSRQVKIKISLFSNFVSRYL